MEFFFKMYMCPERSFVEPVIKDFLSETKSRWELVSDFDLSGRVRPPKLLGFERGIDMCGCHLLEFLYCHIRNEEGGKMTINLQHRRV